MPVKILAYEGIGCISRAIRWQTRSRYSHIGILTPSQTVIEAWHVGGVNENRNFKTVHTPGTWVDVFEFIPNLDEDRALGFWRGQIGRGYAYRDVFRFMSRSPANEKEKWFCSELAAEGARRGGVVLLNLPPHHLTPRDVAASPHLRMVDRWIV